jgi:MFS family permease
MQAKDRKEKLYYGWVIVAIAFISMAIAYALRYSFSVFSVAFEEEFAWSRASIYTAFSIVIMIYGFSSPVAGNLFDKYGPRKIFPIGACFLALGLFSASQITELWHLYLSSGIAALGMACLGYVTNGTLVSTWFVKKRGAAVGTAMSGTGFGMFVIIGFLTPWMIKHYGFAWAYIVLGTISIGFIAPLTAIFLRHHPEDMGLLPDGEIEDAGYQNVNEPDRMGISDTIVDKAWVETEWTLSKAIRTRRFWALFTAVSLFPFSLYAVMLHQVQYAVDVGFSIMVASSAFGMMGLLGMVGKFGWGLLSDRIGREVTYFLGILCNVAGVSLFIILKDPSQLWILYTFSVFFGLSYGIAQPLMTAMAADLFQGRSLGTILGFTGIGVAIGGALGPVFSGYLFDVVGNYRIAFTVAIIAIVLSAASVWIAAPREVRLVTGRVKTSLKQ